MQNCIMQNYIKVLVSVLQNFDHPLFGENVGDQGKRWCFWREFAEIFSSHQKNDKQVSKPIPIMYFGFALCIIFWWILHSSFPWRECKNFRSAFCIMQKPLCIMQKMLYSRHYGCSHIQAHWFAYSHAWCTLDVQPVYPRSLPTLFCVLKCIFCGLKGFAGEVGDRKQWHAAGVTYRHIESHTVMHGARRMCSPFILEACFVFWSVYFVVWRGVVLCDVKYPRPIWRRWCKCLNSQATWPRVLLICYSQIPKWRTPDDNFKGQKQPTMNWRIEVWGLSGHRSKISMSVRWNSEAFAVFTRHVGTCIVQELYGTGNGF